MEAEIAQLKAQVAELQAQLNQRQARPKIEKMSAEVVDSNPYRFDFA
jgi:hypothetical protein